MSKFKINTKCLVGGYKPGNGEPRQIPIIPEKAREIIDDLKFHFHCQYDEKDSIGKRYRRQDAIGTPYCVTVDHQTLEDNCVTLRNRDTMQQERVAISELNNIIADRVSITSLLKTLQ